MDLKHVAREGFVAGLIGAAAVAAWFLIVDIVTARVLHARHAGASSVLGCD